MTIFVYISKKPNYSNYHRSILNKPEFFFKKIASLKKKYIFK